LASCMKSILTFFVSETIFKTICLAVDCSVLG
jgi:hypothetical protein